MSSIAALLFFDDGLFGLFLLEFAGLELFFEEVRLMASREEFRVSYGGLHFSYINIKGQGQIDMIIDDGI